MRAILDEPGVEAVDTHEAQDTCETQDEQRTTCEPQAEPQQPVARWELAIAILERQREIAKAKNHLVECAIRRANLEVELKAAKKAEKNALEAVEAVIEDDTPDKASAAGQQASDPTSGYQAKVSIPADDADNTWRNVPIEHLELRPILAQRLAESNIDTIGQLEDLRAEGSGPYVGLRTIKGIGQAKADEIENAVLTWLSRHRDAAVLAASRLVATDGGEAPGDEGPDQ